MLNGRGQSRNKRKSMAIIRNANIFFYILSRNYFQRLEGEQAAGPQPMTARHVRIPNRIRLT